MTFSKNTELFAKKNSPPPANVFMTSHESHLLLLSFTQSMEVGVSGHLPLSAPRHVGGEFTHIPGIATIQFSPEKGSHARGTPPGLRSVSGMFAPVRNNNQYGEVEQN